MDLGVEAGDSGGSGQSWTVHQHIPPNVSSTSAVLPPMNIHSAGLSLMNYLQQSCTRFSVDEHATPVPQLADLMNNQPHPFGSQALDVFDAFGFKFRVPSQPMAEGGYMDDMQLGNGEDAPLQNSTLQSMGAPTKPRGNGERSTLKLLQIACRPYIFLFVARPETILASNGKAFVFTSPALKAVLKASSRDLEQELYTMTKEHAQSERLTMQDITVLNAQDHHTEEEYACQLIEERAQTAAALAKSAQLWLMVDSHSQ
ncbi:hypothetical protein BDN67DRAFT_982218 [Paxillus ammoniavirescens]|nr:hypothetical protein BDN67DRAFT_982218 [Paxillus ammoniavirescens]